MPRSARRYDIYLPLTYNDGTLIPKEKYEAVEDRLLQHFGGLTWQQRDDFSHDMFYFNEFADRLRLHNPALFEPALFEKLFG